MGGGLQKSHNSPGPNWIQVSPGQESPGKMDGFLLKLSNPLWPATQLEGFIDPQNGCLCRSAVAGALTGAASDTAPRCSSWVAWAHGTLRSSSLSPSSLHQQPGDLGCGAAGRSSASQISRLSFFQHPDRKSTCT